MTRAHYHRFDHYRDVLVDRITSVWDERPAQWTARIDTPWGVYVMGFPFDPTELGDNLHAFVLRDAENAHAYRQAQGAINAS